MQHESPRKHKWHHVQHDKWHHVQHDTSRNLCGPLKENTHSGLAEKKYSNWACQEAPRISSYATCLLPFFLMIAKRPEPLQLFFCCATCRFQTCCRKCCSCLAEQRGSQCALNVSKCQLSTPFTCHVYFFSALSALFLSALK